MTPVNFVLCALNTGIIEFLLFIILLTFINTMFDLELLLRVQIKTHLYSTPEIAFYIYSNKPAVSP